MDITRRDLGKVALAALPAASLLAKPNSKFDGVQIGTITYSYRSTPDANDAVKLLKLIVDSNISAIELMGPPAESFAGAPQSPGRGGGGGARGPGGPGAPGGAPAGPGGPQAAGGPGGARGAGGPGGPGGGRGGRGRGEPGVPLTPEQLAAQAEAQARQREAADKLKQWRLSVSMDKYKEMRKMYNDAGVKIYAYKLEPQPSMSDDEYNYIFNVAEALGASHVTLELSNDLAFTKRIGEFAAKRKMMVAYHAHQQATITAWDAVLEQSKGNAINLDAGHYFAGTAHEPGKNNPIDLILKHHDRIASMHLKDRTKAPPAGQGQAGNLPWGTGETPIKEILQVMRKNKYKFPASCELEYAIPQGSDAVTEVKKCVQYCKDCLA